MSQDVLPSRHQGSPLTRRSRDLSPPTTNCLEVQWRFLQHKNPQPPHFGSPRKPLPQLFFNKQPKCTESRASRGSPSRLIHMFETQETDSEEPNATNSCQIAPQQNSLPEGRVSRTLNDLMGETQRKAMLDRILADMEYLAVEPTYPRLGQSEDTKTQRSTQCARPHQPSIQTSIHNESKEQVQPRQRKFTALWSLGSLTDYSDDDDDDSLDGLSGSQTGYRRQRRRLQQLNQQDEGPRIFWQKSTGAKSAVDVPERLLTLTPSPPHRMKSQHILLGRRSHTPRQQSKTSAIINDKRRKDSQPAPPKTAPRRQLRTPASMSPPPSPPKANYGAWYVPQSEWWSLHRIEQQNITDKFPVLTVSSDKDESHCHGSPIQRQHKPPLPAAALSPRSKETVASVQIASSGGRIPSASSHSGAPPSAPLELQVAGIPQSYIGREYRAYIVSTGSAMPQYLQ
ncbi:hypothetical protein L917_10322 [Phytophthora nicotianae]|nr:hypothetical protein L917_10322 [Phytophthora nicotianae]